MMALTWASPTLEGVMPAKSTGASSFDSTYRYGHGRCGAGEDIGGRRFSGGDRWVHGSEPGQKYYDSPSYALRVFR